MGSTYGDAWIDLLYDIDTQVKITNPSEEVRRVHKINPQKYLVLPGTDKKFPEGVFIGVDDIYYQEREFIRKISPVESQYARQKDLEKCSAGEIYPVTLFRRVANVNDELEAIGIARYDTSNHLVFEPGKLEERLSSARSKFLALLETSGLTPEESKIYFRLVGSNPRF